MKTMDIYFSDLNEKAQQAVLDFFVLQSAKDGNYDIDIIPLFTLEAADDGE